jgi:thiaminase
VEAAVELFEGGKAPCVRATINSDTSVLAPFLASIGDPLIPHIRKVFETDDEIWKCWIMSCIMLESREVAEAFREELERVAYSPTEMQIEEGLNEYAKSILEEYDWQR